MRVCAPWRPAWSTGTLPKSAALLRASHLRAMHPDTQHERRDPDIHEPGFVRLAKRHDFQFINQDFP